MSIYSRTLKHVNHKDFRRTHQRHLGEQKVLRKIEEEKLIQEKKKLEEIKKISSPLKSNWRKDLLKEFGEWVPVANAGGPTMGTSTTFGYYVGGTPIFNYETGQPITYTVSGLGGPDSLPTTVTINQGAGEIFNVAAPTYNQLSLAGYAPTLPLFRRDDYKDVNAMLDASQEYARRVLADVYMAARVEMDRESDRINKQRSEMKAKISNYASKLGIDFEELQKKSQIDKYGRLVVFYHDGITSLNIADNATMRIYHPAKDANGNVLTIYDAGVKTYREFQKLGFFNMESDPYSNSNYFRFDPDDLMQGWGNVAGLAHSTDFGPGHDPNKIGEVLVGPKKVGPKIVGPKYDNRISADDEKFIKDLSILPKIANVAGGLGLAGDLAIRYAKGDYRPVTKSPGSIFDNQVLDLISRSMKMANVSKNTVQVPTYSDAPTGLRDAPVRVALGQFNYEITPEGVRVKDTFNFNKNTSVGALDIIHGMQDTADRLVDIGNKRARSLGLNPDDEKFGIRIDYTIPKSRLSSAQRKQFYGESTTWDKARKHLKGA